MFKPSYAHDLVLAALISIQLGNAYAADTACPRAPAIGRANQIEVLDTRATRLLRPEFFGFNLEWVEFQLSLWDTQNRIVTPELREWLKPFAGAVYRYPGGTVANHFNWAAAIGPIPGRKEQSAVSWRGPLKAEFGPDEFLSFISEVGGKAWYVLNLYGEMGKEMSTETIENGIRRLAARIPKYDKLGAQRIFRWEMGNELDRDRYRWMPEKYIRVARGAHSALLAERPGASAVFLSQDWDALWKDHGIKSKDYNAALISAFGKGSEFAAHVYYDGRPWGPPLQKQIENLCRNIQALSPGEEVPRVWVTEHGRTPKGTPADRDWKANWSQTADMGAALSVADFYITIAAMPAVRGAFIHSLHATNGPWPLFHKTKSGQLVPSAVYWSARLLRESLLEKVLKTGIVATRTTADSEYDIRGQVMADAGDSQYSIWLVNRSAMSRAVGLSIKPLTSKSMTAAISLLHAAPQDSNYGGNVRVRPQHSQQSMSFDAQGNAKIEVPANSVVTVKLKHSGVAP